MSDVTKEQFEFISGMEVRHMPTYATFSTVRYDDPKHFILKTINPGRAGDVLEDGSEYDLEDLMKVASDLLREKLEAQG